MICQLVTATYCNYVESPRNRTCINKSNKCETRILSPLILLRPILWIEFVLTPHLCEWTILKILKHSTSNKKNIKRVCVCIYTYIILNSIKFRHYIIYIYISFIFMIILYCSDLHSRWPLHLRPRGSGSKVSQLFLVKAPPALYGYPVKAPGRR